MPEIDFEFSTKPVWYTLYTKPNQEFIAEECLKAQGFKVYLPRAVGDKRLKQNDIIPMFPSYMFVHLIPGISDFAAIGYTRGVRWLVKSGNHYHICPNDIIEGLYEREEEDGLIVTGQTEFQPFDYVTIIDGPFKDRYGMIRKIKKQAADIWCHTSDIMIGNIPLDQLIPCIGYGNELLL